LLITSPNSIQKIGQKSSIFLSLPITKNSTIISDRL